jgi:hypothetical protein
MKIWKRSRIDLRACAEFFTSMLLVGFGVIFLGASLKVLLWIIFCWKF